MTVSLSCPHCGWTHQVPEGMVGNEVRCERCANAFAPTRPGASAREPADGGPARDPGRRAAPTADAPPRGRPARPWVAGGVGLLVLLAGGAALARLLHSRDPRGEA